MGLSSTTNDKLYRELANELLDARYDCLYLVPWVKSGGSDLELFNHLQAVHEYNPQARCLVMATESEDSPQARSLPDNVKFVSVHRKLSGLSLEDRTKLLGTLLVQLRPAKIHLINSDLGYRALADYAWVIGKYSRLFVSIFCLDQLENGTKWHYIVDYFDDLSDYVTTIFADNQKVIDELADEFKYPSDKFKLLYQPYGSSKDVKLTQPSTPRSPLQVLWAARLDRQKRPDLLLEIARRSSKLPIRFHVYGSPYLDSYDFSAQFDHQPNIIYHGPFAKGLNGLPLNNYDAYLLTSQWEGLPNTILEAAAAGLPVVAPAVGGVPEIISDSSTGYLVDQYDDSAGYIKSLRAMIKEPGQAVSRAINAQKVLSSRHGWSDFLTNLKDRTDYLI